MTWIKLFVRPYDSDEVFSLTQIDDVMRNAYTLEAYE